MASNRSRNADQGNLHFPLKLRKGERGHTIVTSVLAPKRQWVGETEEQAIRAARNELKGLQEQGKLADNQPAWASTGEWKVKQ